MHKIKVVIKPASFSLNFFFFYLVLWCTMKHISQRFPWDSPTYSSIAYVKITYWGKTRWAETWRLVEQFSKAQYLAKMVYKKNDFKSEHITYAEVNKVATEMNHNNKTEMEKKNWPCFSRHWPVHPSAVEWVWEKANPPSPSVPNGALQVHISPQNGWVWRYHGHLSAYKRNET